MKKILSGIVSVLLLVGCGASKTATIKADDFVYANDKGEVKLNEVINPDALGKYTYSESESCGYDGLDKVYTYADCEVYTYPKGGKDYVLYVDLFESGKTSRGIKINDSLEDVKKAYGEDFKEEGDNIVYQLDDLKIKFLVIDGKVTFIEYSYGE